MAMRIAVFAALPQETGPILRLDPGWRRIAGDPFPVHTHWSPGKEVLLVQTGMGVGPAAQAARYIAEDQGAKAPLDLMLSVGFAGALSPDLILGQVVWSRDLAVLTSSGETCLMRYRCGREARPPADAPDVFARHAVTPVRFLTVDRLHPKAELSRLVSQTPAVAEMETTAIAEVAHSCAVPFMGLRAISDELDLEIDLDLDSITDQRGKVRLTRLAAAAVAQPRLVGLLPALYRGSRLAGRNLARVLAALLTLSEEELRALAGPPRPDEE